MLPLSAAAILEKNKLAGGSAWPILLLISIPTTPATVLRLAGNNENVQWPTSGGETWTAFPFELDDLPDTGNGEIPQVVLRVSNVTQEIQYYLEQANGGVGASVSIMVVNSDHLDIATPEIQLDLVCVKCTYDAHWVTFTLGANSSLSRRIPERRYLKDFCPLKYGGVECGAPAGTLITYPTCKKTLAQCRERSNSERFGGEPGLPLGGFYASV